MRARRRYETAPSTPSYEFGQLCGGGDVRRFVDMVECVPIERRREECQAFDLRRVLLKRTIECGEFALHPVLRPFVCGERFGNGNDRHVC
jgi:hypothetical protein